MIVGIETGAGGIAFAGGAATGFGEPPNQRVVARSTLRSPRLAPAAAATTVVTSRINPTVSVLGPCRRPAGRRDGGGKSGTGRGGDKNETDGVEKRSVVRGSGVARCSAPFGSGVVRRGAPCGSGVAKRSAGLGNGVRIGALVAVGVFRCVWLAGGTVD